MTEKKSPNYLVRPFLPGDEEYVADSHVRIYLKEFGFTPVFAEYVVKIPRQFAKGPRDSRDELWIAEADQKPVGCILLLHTEDPGTGQLRQFLVEEEYRGQGIGRALMEALLKKARENGYHKLILQTGDLQKVARRYYAALGFHLVKSWPNEWTADGTVHYDEEWEMELS